VQRSIAQEFTARLAAKTASLRVDDPIGPATATR
jgi:acyl-CoA reductase-like NAD-dependent aldehyde dehydrogenase